MPEAHVAPGLKGGKNGGTNHSQVSGERGSRRSSAPGNQLVSFASVPTWQGLGPLINLFKTL